MCNIWPFKKTENDQNVRHFPHYDILKVIFLIKLYEFRLKFYLSLSIDNKPVSVPVMTCAEQAKDQYSETCL